MSFKYYVCNNCAKGWNHLTKKFPENQLKRLEEEDLKIYGGGQCTICGKITDIKGNPI